MPNEPENQDQVVSAYQKLNQAINDFILEVNGQPLEPKPGTEEEPIPLQNHLALMELYSLAYAMLIESLMRKQISKQVRTEIDSYLMEKRLETSFVEVE